MKLKRVEVLPDGWLGKCPACHVGASAATGDWILFTDADCWLKPDVIARANGRAPFSAWTTWSVTGAPQCGAWSSSWRRIISRRGTSGLDWHWSGEVSGPD